MGGEQRVLRLHLSLLFARLRCCAWHSRMTRLAPLLFARARVLVAAPRFLVLKDAQKRKMHWVHRVQGVFHGGCWSRGGWGRRGEVVLMMPLMFCSCFLLIDVVRFSNWRSRRTEQC
jgi:hypothetical protein